MFYQYSDELTTIEPQDRDPNLVCAAYITLAELDAHYEKFGFSPSTVQQCKEENRYFRSNIEVYDDYSFGTLKITDAANARAREDCLAFYVKKNFLLLVDINDADCSTRNIFISALHRFSCANITLEKLIYAFLESLVSGDNKALEDTEFEINRMEEYVLQDKAGSDFNMELLHKKKELSVLRNYYEQLIDIGEALEENENEIFEREDLRYFKIFTDKAVRLRENVDLLRDSIVHLRDAYLKAERDYEAVYRVDGSVSAAYGDRGLVRHEFSQYAGVDLEIWIFQCDCAFCACGWRACSSL